MKKLLSIITLFLFAITLMSASKDSDGVMTKENGMYVVNTTTLGKKVTGYVAATPLKIYIQKDKLNLGAELKVVPLAFITLYNEKAGTDKDSQFFGTWNKEQAVTFPLADGSNFNRQLPNGHILVPVNWVMVEVLGHPELENAVIA
jgi:hypothetical protein